jgi:hypothetical protein
MKHSIERTDNGLRITASADAAQQQRLLAEFAKCAAGTCSCPTPQYAKMQSIDVRPQPTGVAIDLTVKAGEIVDLADIEACLQHTARVAGA